MTSAFVKYWVEGEQDAIQTLFEAINNGDNWAENSLKNLGVNTEEYDTERVEWCNPELQEKDGQKVLYFEEFFPYERGTLIDQLMQEKQFAGKLSGLYYYVEEGAEADLFVTNDSEGKHFPYRIAAQIVDDFGFCADALYAIDEQQLIKDVREKYNLPEDNNTLEAVEHYFEESKDYESIYVHSISVE